MSMRFKSGSKPDRDAYKACEKTVELQSATLLNSGNRLSEAPGSSRSAAGRLSGPSPSKKRQSLILEATLSEAHL
jgi:hypothetical protein